MAFDTTQYDQIKHNQHGDEITDTLIISKDRKHVQQYRKGKWNDLKIDKDNRFKYWHSDKRQWLSLSQIDKIFKSEHVIEKPSSTEFELCQWYRSKVLKRPLYRKVKCIVDGFTHYDYYQDQGSGLKQLPYVQQAKNLIEYEMPPPQAPPLLTPDVVSDDLEQIYLDFVNEFEEAGDKCSLMIDDKKTEVVCLIDLDIDNNLIQDAPDGLIQLTGMIVDEQRNIIKFTKRPVFHDKEYDHWWQRMERGWYHQYYKNYYSPVKILDDNDKWKHTCDDIEHMKHKESKPSPYDDEPQLWRKRKVVDPKTAFDERYLMIPRLNKIVKVGEEMLYWEMPNDNEPYGRFSNQIGYQVMQDGTKIWLYQDLGVSNGKVDVLIDKGYKCRKLLDLVSFFRDELPMMHPKSVEMMKRSGVYPWKEAKCKTLWEEEEEEVELPYLGWKAGLYQYKDRPRMKVFQRLNEDEEFLMMGFEDKSKRLREETVMMMRSIRRK
jgi:hypothetical protein